MSAINSIRESIMELAKAGQENNENNFIILGTVIDVDLPNNTCRIQPLDTNRTLIDNILLSSDAGVAPSSVPTVGTQVIVNLFSPTSGYIAKSGKVQSVSLAPGTINYGGVVIIADLVARLNAIENLINTFISTTFNTHTHLIILPVPGTPTAVPIPVGVNFLTLTTNSDIENVKVVHGNGHANNTAYKAKLDAALIVLNEAEQVLNNLFTQLRSAQLSLETAKALASANPAAGVDYSNIETTIEGLHKAIKNATLVKNQAQATLDNLIANPE